MQKNALGIFRELIPRTIRTSRVAFWDPPSDPKSGSFHGPRCFVVRMQPKQAYVTFLKVKPLFGWGNCIVIGMAQTASALLYAFNPGDTTCNFWTAEHVIQSDVKRNWVMTATTRTRL